MSATPHREGPPAPVSLRVTEAAGKDVGRGLVRIDPDLLSQLQLQLGDTVEVTGKRRTVGKVMPIYKELRGQARIQMDGVLRENAGVSLDDSVLLAPVVSQSAQKIHLTPTAVTLTQQDLPYLGKLLDGLPVLEGDRIQATLFGSRTAEFRVETTAPRGPVLIGPKTTLTVGKGPEKSEHAPHRSLSYEDIGGLRRQVQRIRELVELPLRFPEVFERLGIDPPKGVLLHGPPGCGKTLIARAIAHETDARFFSVNGPEIIHKFYGESEAHLRKIFEDASKQGPSIIFIDEIDAIAPQREKVTGDVEKRVVAQLLALMDGLNRRKNLIVIAATNIPNALDPALRRPGRFDREIAIPVPDAISRQEILEIHSRGMPLSSDVNLNKLAAVTHGMVGADLEAVCREAAMICLRGLMKDIDFARASIPQAQLMHIQVQMSHFMEALREVEPSAIREVFVEVPHVQWDQIGGLEPVKQQLREAVEWPLTHAELFTQTGLTPPRGILLTGLPGCGKTLLAKAVATESGQNFISVKGPALLSQYVGESERAVREVFRRARQVAPCIVFFDEIESVVPLRKASASDSHVSERVLAQFLAELDGVESLKGVLILGATNRVDMIDPAVLRPGRFDFILDIPLPDLAGRHAILQVHLRQAQVHPNVDLLALARQTEGFSGAQLAGLCQRAAMRTVRRRIGALQQGSNATTTSSSSASSTAGPDTALPSLQIQPEDLEAALKELGADPTLNKEPAHAPV